jgi:hypothetical protein
MTYNQALTDMTQTQVSMTPLTSSAATGGSPIISYSLEWDNGFGGTSFVALAGATTNNIQLTFTISDLTAGSSYEFRYRVRNIFGWSS